MKSVEVSTPAWSGAATTVLETETAREFARSVCIWQRQAGRHGLPWQQGRDPYRIWLSEVMLQQTQVAAVLGYYQRFLAVFPDVASLAAAPVARVMELWSGLGYYSRARNLHACARRIVEEYGGIFPTDPDELVKLPGIGRSTAAAIAVFAAGVRAPILDGNVKRVLCRVFGVEGYPGVRSVHDRLWKLAEDLVPDSDIEAYTQGLMDLGATRCTSRNPRCGDCFLAHLCVAQQTGRVAQLPTRKPARPIPDRFAVMLVLHHAGEILLLRRPPRGIWGGLWCLPEWPVGDSAADARQCANAYAQSRGTVSTIAQLAPIVHGFTHFRLTVEVVAIDLTQRLDASAGIESEIWLDLEDARGAALPAPIKHLLARLWEVSPLHRSSPRQRQGQLL